MATTSDDMRVIRTYFEQTWQSSTPYLFDNEPLEDRPATMWARFSVRVGETTIISIFPHKERESGRIYLEVFVPRGDGNADGQVLIDTFKAAFKQKSLDSYRIRFFNVQSGADDSEADWFKLSATVQYQAEH